MRHNRCDRSIMAMVRTVLSTRDLKLGRICDHNSTTPHRYSYGNYDRKNQSWNSPEKASSGKTNRSRFLGSARSRIASARLRLLLAFGQRLRKRWTEGPREHTRHLLLGVRIANMRSSSWPWSDMFRCIDDMEKARSTWWTPQDRCSRL